MKFLIVCSLLICLTVIAYGKGGKKGGKNGMKKKMTCQGQDADLTSLEPSIKKCSQDGEKRSSDMKFIKTKVCVWEDIGVVLNNRFNKAKFDESIMKLYPGDVGEDLANAFSECITPENVKNLSKEDDCKSYKPLSQCLMRVMMKHCKQPKS